MTLSPELVVWDFDGVLNANLVDGRFVWVDRLQDDLGVDPLAFSQHLFGSGRMAGIIRGQQDLLAVVGAWLDAQGHTIEPEDFLDYWFENDAQEDAEVTRWLNQYSARHVIGTNNEARRTGYIEHEMQFLDRVECVFSSGRMGVAKPEAGFFNEIEVWSDVDPSLILLVDDTSANCTAAAARGWQVFHFTSDTRHTLPARLGVKNAA